MPTKIETKNDIIVVNNIMQMEKPNKLTPEETIELDLAGTNLTSIPDLSAYKQLRILNLSFNRITAIENIPPTVEKLDCAYNRITVLENIPPSVVEFDCSYNRIEVLDQLPAQLKKLWCFKNRIKRILALPEELIEFHCEENPIRDFNRLPKTLEKFYCSLYQSVAKKTKTLRIYQIEPKPTSSFFSKIT